MALTAPTYDLTLLLDLAATDEARAKIVADSRSAIESGGELIGHHDWGQRTLAYEIDKREQAEYHLLQFHAPPELLQGLDHRLRIADEVVRHRIIKLAPGTPPPPDSPRAVEAPSDTNAPSPPPEPSGPAATEAVAEPATPEEHSSSSAAPPDES